MASTAAVRTAEANSVMEQLNRTTDTRYRLVGRMPGGETGAFEVTDSDGNRAVLKWHTDRAVWDRLAFAAILTDRLRTEAGWPVPTQQVLRIGGGAEANQVVLQELMPGAPVVEVTHGVVDRLLALHQDRLGRARPDDPDDWAEGLTRTLVDGGSGYCLHEPLRAYDGRTRALLARVRSIGSSLQPEDVAGTDVVHYDFHPGNVLAVDGELAAIVDTEWVLVGDASFDLVTLALTAFDHPCEGGVVERLWQAATEATDELRRAAYVAHLSLRLVDWAIRHHSSADVDRWLDEANRRLPS